MPTTITNRYFSMIANEYVTKIKEIRDLLRKKRAKYDVAVFENNVTKMETTKKKFADTWKTKWPYYNNEFYIPRTDGEPPPPNAKPFPSDDVLQRLNAKERWEIMATALLARRGVEQRTRLEGFLPKVNAVVDITWFKHQLIKYINPPGYNNEEDEDEDEDVPYPPPI